MYNMRGEELKQTFKNLIARIEDPNNHYALFGQTIEDCAIARERNKFLFENDIISEEEFLANVQKITAARECAIIEHGEWTISFLQRTKTQHTERTLVSSIYSDIYGIEFAEKFMK